MNWYKKHQNVVLCLTKAFSFAQKKKLIKLAYSSKNHHMDFNAHGSGDGYNTKIQFTESHTGIEIRAVILSDIRGFPLYTENWIYPLDEKKRAYKTYNRIVNVIEDLKVEYEDEGYPGPTLQGLVRENLRFIDIDRKKNTNNRTLEAAKYEPGEADWRSSLYGNRYPAPNINITNTNGGTININNGQ
jgi:hypothetical protein